MGEVSHVDEMFFSNDERSLRRGSRVAKRTPTCRPCMVRIEGRNELHECEGVVLDVNPYGMLIRMLEALRIGTEIGIQLMRDETFREPFSTPMSGVVMRHEVGAPGFTDHGIKLVIKDVRTKPSRPVTIPDRKPSRPGGSSRMHSIDFTVGGDAGRRSR